MSFLKRSLPAALLAVVSLAVLAPSAHAGRGFGPMIDAPGGYDGQRRCDPDAERGVLAFRRIVLAKYPWSGPGGIGRGCSIGGQSEHKEGRAWDWMVNAGVRRERAAAQSIIEWLKREDAYGNEAAMARRLGIMYVIWNRKFWSPSWGTSTYCVQRKRGCVDPDDGDLKHPHTDHVHFSFTWDGARKKTTYWHRSRSYVASASAPVGSDGFWYVGRNGDVKASGDAYELGSSTIGLKDAAVDIAAHPGGWGYWVLARSGRVRSFGGAGDHGRGRGTFKAIASNPHGTGYWLLAGDGRVYGRGHAPDLGDAGVRGRDIAGTTTGAGYWVLARSGRVIAFGDAPRLGGIAGSGARAVGLLPSPTGLGYLIAASNGRVFAFGDAVKRGDRAGRTRRPIVGIVGTSTGYALITDKGRAFRF